MRRDAPAGIEVFLAIVREGSLRGAARAFGVGAPTISHQLKALERRLGVDLLVRTTRSIELTDAGRVLLNGAEPAFQALDGAIADARAIGRSKTGSLRLSMPISAYRLVLAPVLGAFRRQHPHLRLEISLNEELVDLAKGGFHAGIRLGDRIADGMVALRVTEALQPCYFASKHYLDAAGRPLRPRDLLTHSCIRYRYISANRVQDWQVREDGQTKTIAAPVTLLFDSMEGVRQAVRDGLGIGWSLRDMIADELRDGSLESLLDPFVDKVEPFYLYFPEQHKRLAVLRLLIDALKARRRGLSFAARDATSASKR